MDKVMQYLELFLQTEKQLVKQERVVVLNRMCQEESYYNPKLPRILVLGRFKAGKSMLINALIGKKLAAVDALEKTAWIARYWPADKEFCYLQKRDDSVCEITVEEFVEKTESNQYSLHFLQEISRIDVGYRSQNNNYTLIDSPGFGSVNAENEKLAMEALKDADLVLYAVDVKKVGNLRETSIVKEIKKSGIPMICVGTKYDGGIAKRKSVQEVKEMVAEFTDFRPEEIYPVSAKMYLNQEEQSDGGMEALLDFCKNVAVQNHIHRANAASSRKFRVNNSLIQQLQDLQNELYKVQKAKNQFENEYDYARSRIRSEMTDFIKTYVPNTLYVEYKEQLIHMIELINRQGMGENGMEILQNMIPEGYMDRYWNHLSEVLMTKLHELWQERFALENDRMEEWKYLMQDSTMIGNMDITHMGKFLQLGYDKELSDKGVKLSFGVAGLASVYEAVLGVNAAQVALSGALMSTGLPIMLIGCGLTAYWLKKKKGEVQQDNIDIRLVLENNINHFADCVIDKCMSKMKSVDAQIKTVYMNYYDKELARYCPGNYTLEELLKECDKYITQLNVESSNLVYFDEKGNKAISELYKMQCELSEIIRELERVSQENKDLKNELEREKEKLKDLQKEKEAAQQEYQTAADNLYRANQKLKRAKQEAEHYKDVAKDYKEKEQTAKEEAENIKADLNNVSKQKKKLEVQLENSKTSSAAERTRLENEIAQAQKREAELKAACSKAEEKAQFAKRDKEAAEEQETQAVGKLQTARTKVANAERELGKANSALDKAKKKLDEQEKENKRLKKELQESWEREHNKEEQLEELQERYDRMCIGSEDEYVERRRHIREDLDGILHNGKNKFVLNEEMDPDLEQFENLIFLEEEQYRNFLQDLEELLQLGNGFLDKHKKNIEILVDDRYLYTRTNEYRIYYGVQRDTKEIFISYIEAYIKNDERSRKLRDNLKNIYTLEDDQIRYKILDAIHSAKKEIVIAVPWIRSKAWERANRYPLSMQNALINALNREPELKVLIVTGISEEDAEKSEREIMTDNMVELMRTQFKPYGNRVQIYNNCAIHIKYLVVDDTCSLHGSLNYLSNQSIYTDCECDVSGNARAGENMEISERPANVEKARFAVYRRANKLYTRL